MHDLKTIVRLNNEAYTSAKLKLDLSDSSKIKDPQRTAPNAILVCYINSSTEFMKISTDILKVDIESSEV